MATSCLYVINNPFDLNELVSKVMRQDLVSLNYFSLTEKRSYHSFGMFV